MTTPLSAVPAKRKSHRWVLLLIAAFSVCFYMFCGVYTVQPMGAVPDGGTIIVWRENGEPFFNSADGACLERTGSVSLLCRMVALGQGPIDRKIMRLPYQRWAYLQSTDGSEFDR